ncbi:hypothetical protein LDENG_00246460 [Lucifuga dentata]|nr:hypothetical protein LDENG_00246460 [Lucifuga dentata]
MAAKVVLVAVPAVLGMASIRVYRVSEAPADGLIARETLNIYTPVPPSAQARFVPEQPGVIESGVTTVRESFLPVAQTVKDVCVSVKRGCVNLYHAGQDVYYYLKDPPPGFLPRLGTITMAGLLGTFLARKVPPGSRFKRLALPVGLMSAGASVCYPAQVVAVFKVTGKKVYAVGQWSGATVSSLFTSKSKENDAKELAATAQPLAAAEPNPEPAGSEEAHPAPCHDPEPNAAADGPARTGEEAEPAQSVPVSDEPVMAVITEELSSVTQAEISSQQTHTDAAVNAESAESGPPSEERSGPVGSNESSEDVSAESSSDATKSSSEPETVQSAALSQETAAAELPADAAVNAESAESGPPSEERSGPVGSNESSEDISAESSSDATKSSSEPETVESAALSQETAAAELPAETLVQSVESEPPADSPPDAAVEEQQTPPPPPPSEPPAAENSTGGAGFKADPALMDFGQSSPEDADLYTTRS